MDKVRTAFYIDKDNIEKLNDATYFYRKETKKHLSMSALLNMCLTKMTARQILKHCLDCNERGK